ncbi:hypothetical protein FBUS_02905 [Fasciolopsis buskii]|uniref:Uncharacterized protein n=1 Tax=Fasciolopsis buskii TaxID=27845 RepID=A0A8E0RJI2_9TREM|nr:hypothetical protein FBUS_02905 [Fasciolopsis buski]
MLDFKFTILTPWTLLSPNLPEDACSDSAADEFANILCERTMFELDRHSFWPRARGEAFIRNSFDSFEERFLRQSEYAVIVLSGHHTSCLDAIYPRFLVFLTRRPSWRGRLLLVFLGSPQSSFIFDTKILTHEPIVFQGAREDGWASDEESWDKLLGVLRSE